MREHYHTSIDNILVTTACVIVGINLARLATAHLAKSANPQIANIGKSLGALVTFA